MRSRTRLSGVWEPWTPWRGRPTKTPSCTVCRAPATYVEITTITGAIIRRDGSIDRLPLPIADPFYCDAHGTVV